MALTQDGALKIAAGRVGLSKKAYLARINRGQKWCSGCKEWHSVDAFTKDSSRGDGLTASCKEYRNRKARQQYKPKGNVSRMGVRYKPIRDGDKRQARHWINHLVKTGRLSNPNDMPCFDCGHVGDDKRHEYDHYLGYTAEHHEAVQAVCSSCHYKRERKGRRQNGRKN